MQKIKNLVLAGLAIVLLLSSCAEDDSVTPMPDPDGPTMNLVTEAGFVDSDTTLEKGTILSVKVMATAGDNPLNTITIQEDGLDIDSLDRLLYNGVPAPANPALLFNDEKQQLTWEIDITLPDDVNFYTYTVIVEDEVGKTASVTVNVTTMTPETPVIEITGKLLLNAAGPVGQGGLDLITGQSVGSQDPSAHIKDEGIDLNLPPDQNWKMQISGVNGSELRLPPAGTTYGDIETVEDIEDAFPQGTMITVSDPVEVGDMFIVKNGDDEFFIEVTAVNVEPANNNDSIEFRIKQ